MESWLLLLLSLFASTALFILFFFSNKKKTIPLPPGPPSLPLIGSRLWLRHSVSDIEHLLKVLHLKYGPIFTLRIGSRDSIFIADRSLAHKALVEHGAAFADRPLPPPAIRFVNSNQHNISSASYGPLWRLFRRNLTTEILHPAKVRLFAPGRNWVLQVLLGELRTRSEESPDRSVVAMESFQFAMFCLLVLMCFGKKLDEKTIREIETAQNRYLLYNRKLIIFSFVPRIAKYVFRGRLKTTMQLQQRQANLFVPLIRARVEHKASSQKHSEGEMFAHSYLDSLLDIKLAEEGGRGLTENEMVTLCSEFLTGGTDTTATALQWIMAELVEHQSIQAKLFEEIENVVAERGSDEEIKEEDLQRMPYLRAVIMEGLRLHPPAHFVLPHAVTQDVQFEGYLIPKNASINFMVALMGWDGRVWREPKEFRPERFMAGGDGEDVDITGSREIKMMPFGVGRRICPGLGLAMLHLEFFVANLVREFKWETVDGEKVDLTEKTKFTVVMEKPLRARITPRKKH
ncbi:hypothetical protein HPP92_002208 [Vanilla planifolia]|uniref:Cytochrome P450 n=1 Tax=Vanilla planifolia TaxID=51239 RepID=A0A835VMK0_VANPL|nr:hypothetical protein HPP92_002208 [Vanilla planifolia]